MSELGRSRRPRILIVDDDPTARLLASAALANDRVEIVEAEDGEGALTRFAESRPDLVILDVTMPGMSGFEACARIRTQLDARDTPILIVTGLDDVESIDRAYEVGATDFLTKPVNWTIFAQRIRYMLRASHALEQMEEARKSAVAASRARIEFLARMSHEMRTPLTAVLGFLDVLDEQQSSSPEERKEALRTIRRNGKRMVRLVDDLLDFAQMDQGNVRLRLGECDPAEIARDVVDAASPSAKSRGLEIRLKIAPELPEKLISDRVRVRQILANLVSNAIKFTERGGVVVELRPWQTEETNGIELVVSDTGVGIHPEHIQRIFDPFEQVDNSLTRAHQGAGLGLSIVKELVAALGGTLRVASRPGVGSRFRATIPTMPAPEVEEEPLTLTSTRITVPTATPVAPAPSEPGLPRDSRVLLVDDSADNQRLIGRLLERAGARIARAEDGEQAVKLAREALELDEPFDAILMDMQMPRLDGYGATSQLRQGGYTRPIIALTAHTVRGERERCIESGCDDYLTKPVDRARLIEVVSRWIEKARVG